MTTGERLKSLRIKKHRTQTDFAADCGISKQLLYKYENSIITNIPTDKIELFAQELGTTPAYLMGWTDDPYDWDKDPHDLIPTIPLSYMEACNDNAQQAWKAMQAVDKDALSYSSSTDSSSSDPDIRRIERARKKMDAKQRQKMMNILKASFEEYFSDDFEDTDDDE